jgi:hypothetical protein
MVRGELVALEQEPKRRRPHRDAKHDDNNQCTSPGLVAKHELGSRDVTMGWGITRTRSDVVRLI